MYESIYPSVRPTVCLSLCCHIIYISIYKSIYSVTHAHTPIFEFNSDTMKLETINYFPKVASLTYAKWNIAFQSTAMQRKWCSQKKCNSMTDYANVIQFGYQKESIFSITSNKNAILTKSACSKQVGLSAT